MKKFLSSLCPLSILLANSCAMSALFTIFSLVEGMDKSDPGLALWLCCLLLCYFGLMLFLRRERSIRAVIFFCAVFFVLQLVMAIVLYGLFSSVTGMLAAISMWIYSYYNCFELCIKKVEVEQYTKTFDLCGLVLIFTVFFCSVKQLPLSHVIPLATTLILCLLAQVLVRGGSEGQKLRGLFMSGTIILFLGLIAACFIALASGGIKKLISLLANCVHAVLAFIYRCINAVFQFLISLMPEKQYESIAPPAIEGIDTSGAEQQAMVFIDPEKLLIAILCIGLVFVAVIIILRIIRGKSSVVISAKDSEKGVKRSKSGLLAALKKTVSRLMKALRFRFMCLLSRNTAPGLLMQIEKHSYKKLHGRALGESCREFLERAQVLYPHAQAELNILCNALDELYFGDSKGLSTEKIKQLRRKIFASENGNTEA